jgi:hypothetical protein
MAASAPAAAAAGQAPVAPSSLERTTSVLMLPNMLWIEPMTS